MRLSGGSSAELKPREWKEVEFPTECTEPGMVWRSGFWCQDP